MAGFTDLPGCHRDRCGYDRARASVRGSMRVVELGAMTVWSADFRPMLLQQGARPVREETTPHYHLARLLDGQATVLQGPRELTVRAGDFYIDDCSQRHEIRTGPARAVGMVFPKALLPLPCDKADTVLRRRIAGQGGIGVLLSGLLMRLTEETSAYRPSDGQRMGSALGGLVAALFDCAAAPERPLPLVSSQKHLALRISRFIQQRLSDPRLTPRTVAAAHGVSPSYLHRLFQDENTTVAALIRRLRLERARFDLADPAQGSTSIQAIAARWGFARATDFARAFRAAYGVPPTDYRRHCRTHSGRIAT